MAFSDAISVNPSSVRGDGARGYEQKPSERANSEPIQTVDITGETLERIARAKLKNALRQKLSYNPRGKPSRRLLASFLLDGDRFCQVARLVYVTSTQIRNMIAEKLHWDAGHYR